MPLQGTAVVAIWNDITEEGRANFYEWHNREHMPERLGIDGFLRGRRYVATQGSPQYFTLYEVRDPAVLGGEAYLARLNAPTRWTSDSVRHFRNVARSLCRTDVSFGAGSGGWLGTLRFDCPRSHDVALMHRLNGILTGLAADQGIVAGHICRADTAVSATRTAEQAGRPDNAVPRWVVMIEASTEDAVRIALAGPLGVAGLAAFELSNAASGIYGLQFDLLATA